jgi:VanZ family protein
MEKALVDNRQTLRRCLIWYWAPVIAYALLIFYLSAQPHPEKHLPEFLFKQVSDKMLHLVEYAVLAALSYRAFRWAAGPVAASRAVLLAVVAASLYAATDEVHQMFVPLREASWLDWAADTFGAAVGSFGWSHIATGGQEAQTGRRSHLPDPGAPRRALHQTRSQRGARRHE